MRFRVKGVNDDRDTCDCCGKTGLKKVVWIEDTETLEIRAFGTTCALSPVKAFGLGKEIKKAVRDFESEIKAAKHKARNEAIVAACKEAYETYPGEWIVTQGLRGEFQIPADSKDFEKYKAAMIAEALA